MIKQLFYLDAIERKKICIFQHFASSVSFFDFLFQYSNLFFLNYVVKNNNLTTLSILKIIFSIAYACHKLYNFYYNYIYNIVSEFKYSDKKRNAFKINKIKYAKNLFSSKKFKAGVNNNDNRAK